MLKRVTEMLRFCILFIWSAAAFASHHGWAPVEAFSNADGTLQFIEMSTSGNSENQLSCCNLFAQNTVTLAENEYAFPSNLTTTQTAGKRLLIATAGFEAAHGITPDYIIPDNFLTTTAGDVWYNSALTWPDGLPTDGVNSYSTGGVIAPGTPTNFSGDTVTLEAGDTTSPEIENVPASALVINSGTAVASDDSRVSEYFEPVSCSDDTDPSPELSIALPAAFAVGATTSVDITCVDSANNEAMASADVTIIASATQYLMTTSTSANVTTLHIINTSEEQQSFTGTLYNRDGDRLGDASQALHSTPVASRGRVTLNATDLETTFGVEPWSGPAMLEVTGSASFELMSKLISPSGLVSNTNCVRDTRVLNIEGPDSVNRTFVRFINTSTATIDSVAGTLYDSSGNVLGSPDTEVVSSLAPKAAVWVNRDKFASLFESWSGEALLEVGQAEGLKLLNLNFVNDETFFNFSCFETSASSDVYLMTSSTSVNVSNLHIVNTSESTQSFTGTLYNKDGERQGSEYQALHSGSIVSKGRLIVTSSDLETIFGVSAWSGPAYLDVAGSYDFELMIKLQSPSGLISNTNCVRSDEVHNIEGFDSSDKTFVRFINIGDSIITNITGTLYDSSGAQVGTADAELWAELSPKQAIWRNRDQISDAVGDNWNGEALLRVSAADDLRLLNLNFANNETFFNFSCYEGVN